MKLYHVSSDISDFRKTVKKFIPRIPELRVSGENETINRICFSDDIRKCLVAMPEYKDDGPYIGGNTTLGIGMRSTIQNRFGIPALFSVYELDTENIKEEHILTPQEINEKGYVFDSLKNSEYWIVNEKIQLRKIETIRYIDFYENISASFNERELQYNNIIYEKSIEPYDREYKYIFLSKEDLYKMKSILKKIHIKNIDIFEKKESKIGTIFILKFIIPAFTDVQRVWKTYFLYCYTNFMNLSHVEQDRLSSVITN